jgi:hypothetical protein
MEQEVHIEQVEQFVASAKPKAEELHRATERLPHVNEDGSSDCEFAEQMYAEHEELRTTVQDLLAEAHKYLTAVEDQITKLGRNLVVISAHEDRIHRDAPRAQFSEAEAQVAALYKRFRQAKSQIVETMKYIDQVLQQAATKQFPGRIPYKWPGLQPGIPDRPSTPEPNVPANADEELKALFAMDCPDRKDRGSAPTPGIK